MTTVPTYLALRRVGLAITSAIVVCLAVTRAAYTAEADGALHTLDMHGTLSPPRVAQLHRAIDTAVASGATALMVTLDCDGVVSANASLLTPMLTAPVPIAVFVPPDGRAAGGCAVVAALADVLLIAPDATVGPALPFQLAEGIQGSVDPVTDGLAEYNQLRRLLPPGPDDAGVTAARLSVEALGAQQALELGIAEGTAADREAAIVALAGREVDKVGVRMTIEVTAATPLVANRPGAADRLLAALATPAVGYLAIVGAVVALLLFGLNRVIAIPLVGLTGPLATYSVVVLPARWWSVALLVVALAALAWDVAVVWVGLPTMVGVVLLAAGSVLLFSGIEHLAVPTPLVVFACAMVIALSLVARRRQDREAAARQLEEAAKDLEAARRVELGLAREDGPVMPGQG